MNNQEFFTKSVTHVLRQKKRCINNATCVYAGPGGTSCAIGCVMPRELAEAADNLSNSDIKSVLYELRDADELFKGVSLRLLDSCQVVHDTVAFRTEADKTLLRMKFQDIAEDFNLEMPNV